MPNPDLSLEVRLISDTTFGRGDGIAGVVDQEVEHDASTGLPIVKVEHSRAYW
ncbi:MAG: hypothetical protein IPK19_25090 [Chloroflexi bacterium]|nr:hypothetical protein [Chloroflexota bacterium]